MNEIHQLIRAARSARASSEKPAPHTVTLNASPAVGQNERVFRPMVSLITRVGKMNRLLFVWAVAYPGAYPRRSTTR
ncbi:hypothetical protein, partial [Pseudomonas aeruginosa]